MMLEKNSADIAKYMGHWLGRMAKPAPGSDVSKAMPPKTIPTFATDDIARKGFLYAGGKYWGDRGKEIMRGAMYTEVWVPRQVRQANPIVIFHGNGQTGTDWLQTPDGRAGLGVLPGQAGLRGLHGRLSRTRALGLRSRSRAGRQDAHRRQSEHSHRPRARAHLDERA